MYKKINENHIISENKDLEIKIRMSKWIIEYREGELILEVDIEPMSDPLGIAVYSDTINQWEPPHEESIGVADKERILKNIEGGLKILDCPYQVF